MGFPPRWFHYSNLSVYLDVTIDFGSVLILYAATTTGNMIAIENANDFEFYSANSAGGIQGYGYQCRNAGCVL